jgi:hypothetical protein
MCARTLRVQQTIIRQGKTTAAANQELFIFKKRDDHGKWRIADDSFSPTNSSAK